MHSQRPFAPGSFNGTITSAHAGAQPARWSAAVPPAAAAAASIASSLQSRAPLSRVPAGMNMLVRAAALPVPGFITAAPPPFMPHAQPQMHTQQQPQLNGRALQHHDSDSDSDSDSDTTDKYAHSKEARQQLGRRRPHKNERDRLPRAQAPSSRAGGHGPSDFKSAQPISAISHMEVAQLLSDGISSSSSSGSNQNSAAVTSPLAANAAASASASSAPAAPAPSPMFKFNRALPPIDVSSLTLPLGWKVRTADAVIIGAGPAGLQCAEQLSRLSPLRTKVDQASNGEGASISSPPHSLSILVLEGRERTGGRVFSETWKQGSSKVVVEHGAAFIHGCDSNNLAFGTAVKYGMRRFIKNDFNDGWFGGGRRLDPDHVFSLRKTFEDIESLMLREAKALLAEMTSRVNARKQEVKMEMGKMEEDDDTAQEERQSLDQTQSNAIKREPDDPSPAPSASDSLSAVDASVASVLGAPLLVKEELSSDSDDDSMTSSSEPAVKREQCDVAVKQEPISEEVQQLQPQTRLPAAKSGLDSDSDSDSDPDDVEPAPATTIPPNSAPTVLPPSAASNPSASPSMPALEGASGRSAIPASRQLVDLTDSCGQQPSSSSSSSSDSSDGEERKLQRHSSTGRKRKIKAESPDSSSNRSSAIAIDISPSPPRSSDRPAAKRRHLRSSSEAHPDEAMQPAEMTASLSYSSPHTACLHVGSRTPRSSDEDSGENQWTPTPLSTTRPSATLPEPEASSDESDFPKKKRRPKRRGSSNQQSLSKARRENQQNLRKFQASITETSPGSSSSAQPPSAASAAQLPIHVHVDPDIDRSVQDVLEQVLDEYKRDHSLSEEDEQIVRSIATSQLGYVGELSKLSVIDMLFSYGATGGERSLVGGFQSVLNKLLHRCVRRSKRDQCYFQVRHDRTVSFIEQPKFKDRSTNRELPLVLCYVPGKEEVYVSHFVVSTASIGIMQASIQRQEKLTEKGIKDRWMPRPKPADATSAASGASASAACSSDWSDSQLKAAIVFSPRLSAAKVEAFCRMGMGCENKVIMQFAPGARFWPRALHVLRGTGHKQWRFYSLGGIRGDDCNVLVAHQPPPMSRQMESKSNAEILAQVMAMLRDMFSGQRNAQDDDNDMDGRYLPRSALVDVSHQWTLYDDPGEASDEFHSSPDEDPSLSRRRQQHREERDAFRYQEQPDDGEWRLKPVVEPIKFDVTRWAQDPYALGAYSFVPQGCHLSIMSKRLQQPEPPVDTDGCLAAGGLYFAGEATSTLDSQQVHGAMESGVRVAKCIVERIQQQMRRQAGAAV